MFLYILECIKNEKDYDYAIYDMIKIRKCKNIELDVRLWLGYREEHLNTYII